MIVGKSGCSSAVSAVSEMGSLSGECCDFTSVRMQRSHEHGKWADANVQ